MRKVLRFGAVVGIVLAGAVGLMGTPSRAQEKGAVTVSRSGGGSIRTVLSERSGIVVNKDSTLEREWIAIHDPGLPLALDGTPGITTAYEEETRYSRGGYEYRGTYAITPSEPLVAVHVRFLLFDIWGEHIRTLGATEVLDLPQGARREFKGEWNLWSENECGEYYASIAYVARARTKSGRVFTADTRAVVEEARKFSAKFSAEDLEPTKPPGQK